MWGERSPQHNGRSSEVGWILFNVPAWPTSPPHRTARDPWRSRVCRFPPGRARNSGAAALADAAHTIVPLVVRRPVHGELDSTLSRPPAAIAADIGTSPLTLNWRSPPTCFAFGVHSVSGWTADRFRLAHGVSHGDRRLQVARSVCALSVALSFGMAGGSSSRAIGGAMITPLARLIRVRSIDRRELVTAIVWVTLPALIRPADRPGAWAALGGFITTFISWHWISWINIPIGLAGIALGDDFIELCGRKRPTRSNPVGAVLAGLGSSGLAFCGSLLRAQSFCPTSAAPSIMIARSPPMPMCCMRGVRRRRARPAPCLHSDHTRRRPRRLIYRSARSDAFLLRAPASPATRLPSHAFSVVPDHAVERRGAMA